MCVAVFKLAVHIFRKELIHLQAPNREQRKQTKMRLPYLLPWQGIRCAPGGVFVLCESLQDWRLRSYQQVLRIKYLVSKSEFVHSCLSKDISLCLPAQHCKFINIFFRRDQLAVLFNLSLKRDSHHHPTRWQIRWLGLYCDQVLKMQITPLLKTTKSLHIH